MIGLLYIPLVIYFAYVNAQWIKQGKHIQHFWNGLIHVLVAGIVYAATREYLPKFNPITSAIAVLFIAKLFFDSSLNIFRGLAIDYISPEVRTYTGLKMAFQKGKVLDYIEYKLFGNDGYTPKILYAFIAIILMVQ